MCDSMYRGPAVVAHATHAHSCLWRHFRCSRCHDPGVLQVCCSVLQHDAVCCSVPCSRYCSVNYMCRRVLQCAAACCSVLQRVAVCCSVPWSRYCIVDYVCHRVLQCVSVCCSVLQCVALCCNVLQCAAVCLGPDTTVWITCVAVCCRVLQCAAACSSVL